MKSAYELALERLEKDGIEPPSQNKLSEETRARMKDVRTRAEAKLAELEILHRKSLERLTDPAELTKAKEEYRAERERIESRRDRELERLRREAHSGPRGDSGTRP